MNEGRVFLGRIAQDLDRPLISAPAIRPVVAPNAVRFDPPNRSSESQRYSGPRRYTRLQMEPSISCGP